MARVTTSTRQRGQEPTQSSLHGHCVIAGLSTGAPVGVSQDSSVLHQLWPYHVITTGPLSLGDLEDLEGEPLPTLLQGHAITPQASRGMGRHVP